MVTQNKTKTIIIERKNKEGKITARITYAKVTARIAEFHKLGKGKITTEYFLQAPILIFRATVTPKCEEPERFFTGTSFGKLGEDKALEKIETLAVGRALAFAGYLSDGEIASFEEMERYENALATIETAPALEKINSAKNLDALAEVWFNLTQDEKNNKEVALAKDVKKEKFQTIQIETAPEEEVKNN